MSVIHPPISAAILAGGAATRMGGGQKAITLLNGKPLITHQTNLLKPLTDDLLVIANPPHDQFLDVGSVFADLIPGKGPLSGIHAALSHALHPQVLVLACDMPLITQELLVFLITHSRHHQHKAVIPFHQTGFEPLISVWPKGLFSDLNDWILAGNPNKIIRFLEENDAMVTLDARQFGQQFANMNTPDDLLQIKAFIQDDSKLDSRKHYI
jgi:molybdenum cofactor guanylyltransferase